MSFSSIYNRIFWKNRPNTSTALGATNLNKMDSALATIDTRVVELDTSKLDLSVGNQLVKSVTFTENTGILTVTLLNGTQTVYDTAIEKIATNFYYDKNTQTLVLTLVDGSTQSVDLSDLVTQYEFLNSTTIAFSVNASGKISASIKNGSVTEDKLQPNYLANIKAEVGKAQTASASALESSENAAYDAKLSQSYAVGGSGIREGEDEDNAKIYKELAEQAYNNIQNSEVTGVKGNAEVNYRKGNVNLTPENIGALSVNGNAVSATKATQDGNGNNIANTYLSKTGDSTNNTISFSSDDVANPTTWTEVSALASGEKHSSIFNKVSKMFKNVRYIWKLLGTTDISTIGNGTITGAVSSLNGNLANVNTNIRSIKTWRENEYNTEFPDYPLPFVYGAVLRIYGNAVPGNPNSATDTYYIAVDSHGYFYTGTQTNRVKTITWNQI